MVSFLSPDPLVPAPRARDFLRCLGVALLLTLAHLALLLAAATRGGTLAERYEAYVQHDSYWFWNIIDHGYRTPVPPSPVKRMEISNTAFFPGFPLWAGAVRRVTGLEPKLSLLLASQIATVGFWTYFLLFARRRLGLPPAACAFATALVLLHPAAFYLIAAYSESLFLFFLLGYLFWTARAATGAGGFALAALHGVGITATRIAGVPAAAYPVLRAWLDEKRRSTVLALAAPELRRSLLLATVSVTGTLAFFAFCHVRWGHWNLYMLTQEAGWGVRADYLAIFKLGTWSIWFPQWESAWLIGRFLTPMTTLGYVALAAWEIAAARRRPTRWRERVGLHLVGFALFTLAVSGVHSVRLESMTRYHFCTQVFLALGLVHAFRDIGPATPWVRRFLILVAALLALFGAYLQLHFVGQFTAGGWVA